MSRNGGRSKRQGWWKTGQVKYDCRLRSWNLVTIAEKVSKVSFVCTRAFACPERVSQVHTTQVHTTQVHTIHNKRNPFLFYTFIHTRVDHGVALLPRHQHGSHTCPSRLVVHGCQRLRSNHSSTLLSSSSRSLALTGWTAGPETRHRNVL